MDWKGIDCYFCMMIFHTLYLAAQELDGVNDQCGPQSCFNGPSHSLLYLNVSYTKLYLTLLSFRPSPFLPTDSRFLESPDSAVPL